MRVVRQSDGPIMRHVLMIAVAGLSLAGCSSSSFEPMKAPTLVVKLQIDSVPQGADAVLSWGPACKTPCEIPLTNPVGDLTVTFTRNEFLPVTVPVKVTFVPSSFWSWGGAIVDPNPVVVQLQPVPPPPPPPRHMRKMLPKAPKPPKTAAAPASAGSPFPAAPAPTR
jgi:hypothetical protein